MKALWSKASEQLADEFDNLSAKLSIRSGPDSEIVFSGFILSCESSRFLIHPGRNICLSQSVEGNGIGCVAVHPLRTHFCVCEKGVSPTIYIYEYPSMNLYKVLPLRVLLNKLWYCRSVTITSLCWIASNNVALTGLSTLCTFQCFCIPVCIPQCKCLVFSGCR